MSCELTMAFSDFRQNSVLASIVSGCLAELGAPEWTEADYALAKKFLSSYDAHTREEMRRDLEQPVAVEAAKRECRAPVSYTHLDVYKRQIVSFSGSTRLSPEPM